MKKFTSRHALALFGALFILSMSNVTDASAEGQICWEQTLNGSTTTECEYISVLKANCALSDPDNVSDVCQAATIPLREGAPGNLTREQNDGHSRIN